MAHKTGFRNAVLAAIDGTTPPLKGNMKKAAARARLNRRPLLWLSLSAKVRNMYERDTGEAIGAGIDWITILDWLMENLPKILALIMALFDDDE